MKRTAFDDRQDREVADDYLTNHLPCRWCNNPAPRDDLSNFGGRCQQCYRDWCAQANPSWWPNRPLQPHERTAVIKRAKDKAGRIGAMPTDGRRWAHSLRDRELNHGGILASGLRMTAAQREAWRTVLHERVVVDVEAHEVVDQAEAA